MPSFFLSPEEHRNALALVRRMELRPGGMVWSALLGALEMDRPRVPVPVLASRKAPRVGTGTVADFIDAAERLYTHAGFGNNKARKEASL